MSLTKREAMLTGKVVCMLTCFLMISYKNNIRTTVSFALKPCSRSFAPTFVNDMGTVRKFRTQYALGRGCQEFLYATYFSGLNGQNPWVRLGGVSKFGRVLHTEFTNGPMAKIV